MFRKLSLSMFLMVTILFTLNAVAQNKPQAKPGPSLEATTDDGRIVLLKPDGTWTFTGRKRSMPSPSGKPNGAPSQAEVQNCINSSEDPSIKGGLSINGGLLEQLQFGKPTTSQGGMMELAMGAPKDTTIFPAKYVLRTIDGTPNEHTIWIFKDSFGHWRCARAN